MTMLLPEQLQPNPFLRARYLCEAMRQPQAAFDQFNLELGLQLGDLPFHSYDKEAAGSVSNNESGPSFLHLIGYHLYHFEPYGTTDSLNLPYGEVFSACWQLYPDWQWLQLLGEKDFLAPSVDQLYIHPVHKSEFGDRKSPIVVQLALQKSQEQGILWLGHGSWHPFGVVRFDPDDITERNSPKLLGLREWLIDRSLSNISLQPSDEEEFWKTLSITHAQWILEQGLSYLSIHKGRPSVTLRNWSLPRTRAPFWKQFANLLEQILHREESEQRLCAEYALLPPSKMLRASEFLGDVWGIATGKTVDTTGKWIE